MAARSPGRHGVHGCCAGVRPEHRDPLDPREREQSQRYERERLGADRRTAHGASDREEGDEEDRIAGVLREHRAGVGERGDEHRQPGDEDRRPPGHEQPSKEIRRDRGQRHHEGVDDEGDVVGDIPIPDQRPDRGDHGGVHLAPAEYRHAPHGGPPALGDAPREVRVDKLVGQDPRARSAERDPRPRERRDADDGHEPRRRGTGELREPGRRRPIGDARIVGPDLPAQRHDRAQHGHPERAVHLEEGEDCRSVQPRKAGTARPGRTD